MSQLFDHTRAAPPPQAGGPVFSDPDPEFAAVKDKMPLGPEDDPALDLLLKRVRRTTGPDLARQARRDLKLEDLMQRPQELRGAPIHFLGEVVVLLPEESKCGKDGWVYMALIGNRERVVWPIFCLLEEQPQGIRLGQGLFERVSFVGYFLKLRSFSPGEPFFGPLLVGRLELLDRQHLKNQGAVKKPSAKEPPDERVEIKIDEQGRAVFFDYPNEPDSARKMIKYQADMVRLNARNAGRVVKAGDPLPAVVVFLVDPDVPFEKISPCITACRETGLRKFAFLVDGPPKGEKGPPAPIPRPALEGVSSSLRTVPVVLHADFRGGIGRVEIGENQYDDWAAAKHELESIFRDPDLLFDQAHLWVDPRLKYNGFLEATGFLRGLSVNAMSLGELQSEP